MVPVTCSVCQKRLIMWDTRPVFAYEYDYETKGSKVLSAIICNVCLPDDRYRLEPTKKPHHDIVIEEPEPFSEPEDGSQDRFYRRKSQVPWLRHTFWWLVHNCVAHPLIGIVPLTSLFKFHDWTSRKMHDK